MKKVESVLTKFKTSQALFDLLVWTSLYIAYSKSRSETIKYIILQNRSQNSKLNLIPDSTERQKLNLNLFVENWGIGQEKRAREKRGKGGGGGGGGEEGRSKAAPRTPPNPPPLPSSFLVGGQFLRVPFNRWLFTG